MDKENIEIHFGQDNERDIVELINELALALNKGRDTVTIIHKEGYSEEGCSDWESDTSHLECN